MIVTLIFTFLLPSPSFSLVSLSSPSSPVKVKPGDFATQVVEVISDTDIPPVYNLKLNLPEGWKLLQPLSPVFLKANVPSYFFITCQIPLSYLAGEYKSSVEFILPSKGTLAKTFFVTRVLEVRSVSIQAPLARRIEPGEKVNYTFRVTNRGNVEDTYRVTFTSSPTWGAKLSQPTVSLSPGAVGKVKVSFASPLTTKVKRHLLRVKVTSISEPGIFAEAEVRSFILPPKPRQISKILYPFLPANIKIKGEYDPETKNTTSGADIDVAGPVGESGRVSVSASIPDMKKPSLSLNSYFIQAYRKDWKIGWGDTSASFTSILSSSGRGLKIEKGNLPWGRNFSFFSTFSGEKGKMGAGFEIPAKNSLLRIGAMRDEDEPDGLVGFSLSHNFSKGFSTRTEDTFTLGKKKDYLLMGGVFYFKKNFSCSSSYYYGSPDFPKGISDKKIFSFSSRASPYPNIQFSTSLTSTRTNLKNDPTRPLRKDTSVTFSFLSTSPHFLPYRMEFHREWYSGSHPSVDSSSWNFRFSAQKSIPGSFLPVTLYGWIETGELRDRLTGKIFELGRYRGQVSGYWRNLFFWLWQEEGKKWDKDKNEVVLSRMRGTGLDYYFSLGKCSFHIGYSNTGNGNWKETLSSSISYPLGSRSYLQVGVKGEGPAKGVKDWTVAFTLGTGFGVPLFLVKTKGTIEGTIFLDRNFNGVFDAGDEGLKDFIISIPGVSVSTDENGEYRFPSLVPGFYKLWIDKLPAGWVSWKKLPLSVEVKAGKIRKVDIPLVQSSTIKGKVYRDTNRNGKEDKGERGVPGVRVVARDASGKELESFTDNMGDFEICDLFPGSYEVYPDPDWIPEKMKFTTSNKVKLGLEPGEVKSCRFGIAPPKRKIIITFQPPRAIFSFSPSSPRVGEKVTFDGSASFDPDGRVVKYEWDFNNDGKVDKRGAVVRYIFKKIGVYPVTLIVTDNDGNLGFITHEVKVR